MLVLPFAIPAILYIILSFTSVQKAIGQRTERELSQLLGTEVTLGNLSVSPFNRVLLSDVTVLDENGEIALNVGQLGAGISIGESIWNRRIIITYGELIDVHLNLYRDSINAPLNIEPVINRFKSKDKKESSAFDLSINMVVIRRSSVNYNVRDEKLPSEGIFDKNHISISDLSADLRAPRIANDNFKVEIKRMAANERSGLTLNDLSAYIVIDSINAKVDNLMLALKDTELSFGEINITSPLNKSFKLTTALNNYLELFEGSHISLSDLSPFVPQLRNIDTTLDIEFLAEGNSDNLEIRKFELASIDHNFWTSFTGNIRDINKGIDSLFFNVRGLDFGVDTSIIPQISKLSNNFSNTPNKFDNLVSLGVINVRGDLSGSKRDLDFNGKIRSGCGDITIDAVGSRHSAKSPIRLQGNIKTESFDPSAIDPRISKLSNIAFDALFDLEFEKGGYINGNAELEIPTILYAGNIYSDIEANAIFTGNHVEGKIGSSSPLLDFTISGEGEIYGSDAQTVVFANINNISLSPFVNGKYSDFSISLDADISLRGRSIDNVDGRINISDFNFYNDDNEGLALNYINIESNSVDSLRTISLSSEPFDAKITGVYTFTSLPQELKCLIGKVFPSLRSPLEHSLPMSTDMLVDIHLKEDTLLSQFFKLPVEIIYPVTIDAQINSQKGIIGFNLDAPYLKQKNKLIEKTQVKGFIDAFNDSSLLTVTTSLPTKNGMLDFDLNSSGKSDSIISDILWKVNRKEDFHGELKFATNFNRDNNNNRLTTEVIFKPTQLTFNDSAWNVYPGHIRIVPDEISVHNFGGGRGNQSLSINGSASKDSLDRLVVSLEHIDLDYIFETLNISDAVMFGGNATGDFYGSALLSKEPVLYTPRLWVESLKYNFCEMGDADIKSYWDNTTKSIGIDAVISQKNGDKSLITGFIRPFTEELDFNFSADNAPVGFMLPFMSAFTSKIDGEVSGNAHLFGTFKDLDMTGDIFIKDLSMKLDFTNTVYTTTDSVHITPGLIKFSDVTLKDMYGKTAILSGYVTHEYFHNPTFKFNVTNAKDFLVYDVDEYSTEDPWYGKIFGNGSATVTGVPGKVDIGVTMSTAPKSTFTFVLSDAENATEYDFITLRDRDAAIKDSIAAIDAPPLIVRQLKEKINKAESSPSVYAMEFNVDITPAATMNLIMDPIGGDKIIANGSGHLRMTYSSDGDLRMYGDYTLDRGSYNFTLQDIIIKDFTIKEGSKISFLGDPYAAQLYITASYVVNANLSDLDESFLEDKELNRTNVPVEALLNVRGDMRQPDLSFDLAFPTLTRDTYRKVRSIVSTEDMMNRQIIYLLALNRFYTPDYMSTTHGNELVSVASSTISSRLGSMLGQLSDNWSIAPTIRSDRGDFSDVEVDVALSSHLLNNRLLFNGNLGYRDKALNNNSFIGDFDIRYLLNRAGTIQLKAYNRYNDQNYYLKSALTTQGVGIVFKRDFDNIFSFLRRKKKTNDEDEKENKEPDEEDNANTENKSDSKE
ncbi:MAG: translocation/assembly module TamB [Muribaculum sp.]|nr:translocation/assembly module TamB [Muribaculum sp.]